MEEKSRSAWSSPEESAKRIRKPLYTDRKRDLGISFYEDIPGNNDMERRKWVYDWLEKIGCLGNYENFGQIIKRMRISTNVMNDQVLIECHKEGQSDEMYTNGKMKDIPSPFHARVYAMDREPEIMVKISWVRASMDVQTYLVDNFLAKYGTVKKHFPLKDFNDVETFEHAFIMLEKDIYEHPPPNFVWMGREKLRVKYKGQIQSCWICDDPMHRAVDCPKNRKNRENATQGTPSGAELQKFNQDFPDTLNNNNNTKNMANAGESAPQTSHEKNNGGSGKNDNVREVTTDTDVNKTSETLNKLLSSESKTLGLSDCINTRQSQKREHEDDEKTEQVKKKDKTRKNNKSRIEIQTINHHQNNGEPMDFTNEQISITTEDSDNQTKGVT